MADVEGIKQLWDLSVYGPLGFLAALGIATSVKLYLDSRHDRKEHQRIQKELQDKHDAKSKEVQDKHDEEREEWVNQLQVLAERYQVKSDNNIEKYHSLVEGLNRVLDSASRRYPRLGRGAHGRQEGSDD